MAGRPGLTHEEIITKINDLNEDYSMKHIAEEFFKINERTIYRWRNGERNPTIAHKRVIMRRWGYYHRGY